MRSEARVSKWGNSLAIRIPRDVAKQAKLSEGDSVALALDGNGAIMLLPTRRRSALSELVSQINPKNRHRETDWGRVAGDESR